MIEDAKLPVCLTVECPKFITFPNQKKCMDCRCFPTCLKEFRKEYETKRRKTA
jgi:hypothetical protein